MATYILKRKVFTRWDETDNLKRMKDSDILAEQKRSTSPTVSSVSDTLASTATGAVAGATALGAAKGLSGAFGKAATVGGKMGNAWKGLKSGGKWGALAGGVIAGTMALNKHNKQAEDNKFYNKRLEYAQRQAKRREKADWKSNMTQREGYSY